MKLAAKFASGVAVMVMAVSGPAMAKETWTMTTTWPSSLELIEFDKHWVELVNTLAGDELQINFFEGGAIVPSGEVFGAVQSGDLQAGGDWPAIGPAAAPRSLRWRPTPACSTPLTT